MEFDGNRTHDSHAQLICKVPMLQLTRQSLLKSLPCQKFLGEISIMKDPSGKRVFVTVGTTCFDKLVQTVTSASILQVLRQLGYTKVVLQIGRGKNTPKNETDDELPVVESFTMKDTISEDLRLADLVISHAGAGSILETLEAGRPLIVVINEDLMGNHQTELAGKLADLNHLVCCKCSSLEEVLQSFDPMHLQPMERGNPKRLASLLDEMMNFS